MVSSWHGLTKSPLRELGPLSNAVIMAFLLMTGWAEWLYNRLTVWEVTQEAGLWNQCILSLSEPNAAQFSPNLYPLKIMVCLSVHTSLYLTWCCFLCGWVCCAHRVNFALSDWHFAQLQKLPQTCLWLCFLGQSFVPGVWVLQLNWIKHKTKL